MVAFTSAVLFLVFTSIPSLAAVNSLRPILKFKGKTSGRYIIKLKDGADQGRFTFPGARTGANITHQWDIFNGFAGTFNQDTLNGLRADPEVDFIEEDGILDINAPVTQTNAPWGIARVSSVARLTGNPSSLSFTYRYDSSAGAGVNVYVIDTGIRTSHNDFGGRARWGATFGGYASADGHGHGTHCAGTVGGTQFGIAKLVTLVAVKVLSDSGSGAVSDIVSGINWIRSDLSSNGRAGVASMSLGGAVSAALDNAVSSAISSGIHFAVAAGNSNTDAGNTSPARVPTANTVGATDINDARATFSNYGSVVDIYAPGVNIPSTWATSNTATNIISGTSMATPHVAGVIAYLIARDGNLSPAAMSSKLRTLCLKNVITNLPAGGNNCLLHIDW